VKFEHIRRNLLARKENRIKYRREYSNNNDRVPIVSVLCFFAFRRNGGVHFLRASFSSFLPFLGKVPVFFQLKESFLQEAAQLTVPPAAVVL
jgi:hypothetical protein